MHVRSKEWCMPSDVVLASRIMQWGEKLHGSAIII